MKNKNVFPDKYARLLKQLSEMKKAVIAFSGGVDSTFLLCAAREALGDGVLAVTFDTIYVPRREITAARQLAKSLDVRHEVIEIPFLPEMRKNPPDHCYICKKHLFSLLAEKAKSEGILHIIEGSNTDDLGDDRPGFQAVKELNIKSPLLEAGFSKADIRIQSQKLGLPTWDKPAYACLLSRLPAGVNVTEEIMERIERSENFLSDIGFPAVRVRIHGDIARIEVPPDQVISLANAEKKHQISGTLKKYGFRHVTLDLAGYQTGSMNPQRIEPA